LESELTISVKYIDYGLNEIKNLTGMSDSNHLAFYMLSNGFERLMKCILCFWVFKNKGSFPNVINYRHNLNKLTDKIVKICYEMDYKKRCQAAAEDVDFLEKDTLLQKVIDLLSKFGKETRYYNFDKLARVKIDYDDPNKVIEDIEEQIIAQNPILKDIQCKPEKSKEFTNLLNQEILKLFRRYSRALCRLFTLGDLGKDAVTMYTHVSNFISFMDSDL